MDAKPHRPLRPFAAQPIRDENEPLNPTMPKSKNFDPQLALSQSTVAGGFKSTARRTAFGDLSNTTGANHVTNVNGLGKPPGPKATNKMVLCKDHNKENAVKNGKAKDAFLRPAQRPVNASKAPSATTQGFPVQNDHRAQHMAKQTATRKTTVVYKDQQQQSSQNLLRRQYKSQPQLKSTEAPVLRRSASKHVIQETHYEAIDNEIEDEPYEDAIEEPHGDEQSAYRWVPMPGLAGPRVAAEAEGLQSVTLAAGVQQHLPAGPPTHEPEEYWDDEDDEHIHDEQGYTTAHSFRSYGDNTANVTTLVVPKKTARIQEELEAARVYVEASRPQEDIDEEDWDVSMVAEYGEEIFEYMRELEERMRPNPHYMDQVQVEIQWSMRSILMDWLVQVHNRFALLPETLFLTVNYIDRFLSSKMVSLGKLQLVGATAIFVAAKYEEINCPSVQEIVFMVDGGYTVDEILKAERFMLSMLQFELGWPGPMSFLRRISKADDYDLETRTLAKYFLEVTIMDERFVGCQPSYLAAGAHCLARLILKKGDWVSFDPVFGQRFDHLKLKSLWSLAHIHYSGYTWVQIKPLVAMVLECCRTPQKHHSAVYEKYCDRRFKKSSIFVQEELAKGFVLPFYNAIPRPSLCSAVDEQSAQIRFPPPENNGVLISTEG